MSESEWFYFTKKQLSIPSMVEAFDLTGNYRYDEAFLIREAVRQIMLDKGIVVPEI